MDEQTSPMTWSLGAPAPVTAAAAEAPHDADAWVLETCMGSTGTCPAELLELLMGDERCVAFGPVHHLLVGAALLTCHRNAEAAPDRDARLAGDLEELRRRAACVPGAACARWGVCGAAASAGMARAIICEGAPLKARGWSENQLMVARILTRIAQAGRPRCCKRDARIAVELAAESFRDELGSGVEASERVPVCATMAENSVCMGTACPYHPR
ncbi:MAG: DUF5714 domain-containing protein [Coriobacteriales bacterium]|jgi:hypothetical protein